ncbi:MAG: sulfite exporter TauE/SafE family protein [Tepidiformaceae bacterium]
MARKRRGGDCAVRMDLLTGTGLLVAAFIAGAINSVAGGGSLVSFPALIAAGYATKTANVTNTVALWPGYIGGSYGYRGELQRQRRRIIALAVPSIAGGLLGSAILLYTPDSAFDAIVPFLILFACAVMALQDRLSAFAASHRLQSQHDDHVPVSLLVATFALSLYGGYFGAGLGILLFAGLAILLPDDIQHTNALKGLLSALINAVALISFVAFGPVRWLPAVVMAVGALAGGYLGVGVARKLGKRWLRLAVISYGLIVAIVLLVR